MSHDDIINAARRGWVEGGAIVHFPEVLLRKCMEAAAAAEREACAVIAETPVSGEQDDITMEAKDRVAAAIRARSNT